MGQALQGWRALRGVLLSKVILLLLVPTATPHAPHSPPTQLTRQRLATVTFSTLPVVPGNGTAHPAAHALLARHPLLPGGSRTVMKILPAPRRRSSAAGQAGVTTLRRDKRQTTGFHPPASGDPRLDRLRKRKKRRQDKRKKQRFRNLQRNGRNFKKRRRRLKLGEKSIRASVMPISALLDGQPSHSFMNTRIQYVPSLASLHNHNNHLVQMLTGGKKQFIVLPNPDDFMNSTNAKETTQSLRRRPRTKKLIFLPFKVVSGGGLEWLPYNPDIRVSIQVTGKQHYDHAPTSRQPDHSDHSHQQSGQYVTTLETHSGSIFSSDTDRIKDKSLKNLSRADATSTMNTFDKTSDSDSNTKKDKARHIIKTAKSTDISENVKNGAELTPETSLKINSPKQKTSDVRESDQKAPTQPHNNGSTSKDARVHKDEHKNLTRTSGRQRAMSSTDMVVRLADALEGILRSEDNMHHTLSASTRDGDACDSWSSCRVEKALQDLTNITALPACPCVYPAELPYQPRIYDHSQNTNFKWSVVSRERARLDVYHRGAQHCIRSHVTAASIAAQTCCYDGERKLLTRGSGAGSPVLVSPQVSLALHWQVDILPWLVCKGNFLRYQAVRQPNNGLKCAINPDMIKYQQQVYMATDY